MLLILSKLKQNHARLRVHYLKPNLSLFWGRFLQKVNSCSVFQDLLRLQRLDFFKVQRYSYQTKYQVNGIHILAISPLISVCTTSKQGFLVGCGPIFCQSSR